VLYIHVGARCSHWIGPLAALLSAGARCFGAVPPRQCGLLLRIQPGRAPPAVVTKAENLATVRRSAALPVTLSSLLPSCYGTVLSCNMTAGRPALASGPVQPVWRPAPPHSHMLQADRVSQVSAMRRPTSPPAGMHA
jgi:hypothetical protein